MTLGKEDLIAALRLRYDHYSATAVFEAACARAGLADQATYEARELATLRDALGKVGDRLDKVNARLDALLAGAPALTPTAADPKPAKGKPAEAKPEASASAKPDANASAKPEAKPEAKLDAKPEAKPEAKTDAVPAAKADAKATPDAKTTAQPAPAATATTIALTGVEAGEGEQILVCGGAAALGDWDPAKARPMAREGAHWLTTIDVPAGTAITFKFLRRSADGAVVWEAGDDRSLAATPRVEATWRSSAS